MNLFLKIVISIFFVIVIFSFHITRDGKIVTPIGEGTVSLKSGTYERFPLPEYAAKMVNFDYKSYFVEVEPGLKVHILEIGEGLPVLLMHGNPTSGFLYRKVAEKLPLNKVRVIMPTTIGLGFSSKIPASHHTLENHIMWISATLKKLELSEVIYAGQDWGGPIGMGALSESPHLLKGAILLNTGFISPKEKADFTSIHATVKTPIVGEFLIEVFFDLFKQLRKVQGEPESWSKDVIELYKKPLVESGNSKAPLAMMRMVPDGPSHRDAPAMLRVEEYVKSLKIPAEIVWGMRDPILSRGLPQMKRNFPEAHVLETEAGHFLQEEVSAEIADAIKRVINEIEK